ncbi:FmdE family protein [Dehalobacter sp. DCM]|uniref:FmdE family protein n=1 Tax=Dehalobacter sp. DCM TaxID=2907827 RepID=UPI0030818421|nr:FmdE family protein [Dehalobacter sp. DCM]
MCKEKTPWEKCVEFHGHECMGLATGFRQANAALDALGIVRGTAEELTAVVENRNCSTDAIQVLTGCTFGKSNFIYNQTGNQALTLANKRTGKAVRILAKPKATRPEDGSYNALRAKISDGTATEEEKAVWTVQSKGRINAFLSAPIDDLYTIEEVPMP